MGSENRHFRASMEELVEYDAKNSSLIISPKLSEDYPLASANSLAQPPSAHGRDELYAGSLRDMWRQRRRISLNSLDLLQHVLGAVFANQMEAIDPPDFVASLHGGRGREGSTRGMLTVENFSPIKIIQEHKDLVLHVTSQLRISTKKILMVSSGLRVWTSAGIQVRVPRDAIPATEQDLRRALKLITNMSLAARQQQSEGDASADRHETHFYQRAVEMRPASGRGLSVWVDVWEESKPFKHATIFSANPHIMTIKSKSFRWTSLAQMIYAVGMHWSAPHLAKTCITDALRGINK